MTGIAKQFSGHTLNHVAILITGNARQDEWTGPPPYRTASQIDRWIQHFVPGFTLGGASRYPGTRDLLGRLNETTDGQETLKAMITAVLDPRDYAQWSALLDDDIESLNNELWYDGFRLVREPRTIRLENIPGIPVAGYSLDQTLETLEWEPVERDFHRMLDNCDMDPEDAITSACALIESVCRSILTDLGVPIPKKRTVTVLYGAVADELALAAGRSDLADDVASEVRRVLGSLANTASAIGELRTKIGDAHGREHTVRRVDARIARLAIGSAATLTQFLIETWRQRSRTK